MSFFLWWVLALAYGLFLTVQDFRKMLVDDRKNYFMMGLSVGLLFVIDRPFWLALVGLVVVILWRYFLKKYQVIGEGDINAGVWMIYGLFLIDYRLLLAFFLWLSALSVVFTYLKRVMLKDVKGKMPFYFVMFLSLVFVFLKLWFDGYSFI